MCTSNVGSMAVYERLHLNLCKNFLIRMTMGMMNKFGLVISSVFLLSTGVYAKPLNIAAHQTEIYIPDRVEANNTNRMAASNTSNSNNTGTNFDDLFNEGRTADRPERKTRNVKISWLRYMRISPNHKIETTITSQITIGKKFHG